MLRQSSVSIVTPVAIVVIGVASAIALVRQQKSITKLNHAVTQLHDTDRIACQILNADANVRVRQATNANRSQDAQRVYVDDIGRVIGLFHHPTSGKPPTAAQRAATAVFITYLKSQQSVYRVTLSNTQKNIALTEQLADEDTTLASQLSC